MFVERLFLYCFDITTQNNANQQLNMHTIHISAA